MKIFIADGSQVGSGRLLVLLDGIPGLVVAGYAQEASAAVKSILKEKPDVVILDIEMQGGSGLGVLRQIKQSLPSTVVIIVTNVSDAQYRKRCADLGAESFFDKTKEFQNVPDLIRKLASRIDPPEDQPPIGTESLPKRGIVNPG